MVEVVENKNYAKIMYRRAERFVTESDRASGWHISDIMSPRVTYFKKVDSDGSLNIREVGLFFVGQLFHENIEKIMRDADGGQSEREVVFAEVTGTIDHDDGEFLYEIKPTRTWKFGLSDDYINQLQFYAAMLKRNKCRLVLLYINIKINNEYIPTFVVHDVTYTDEELSDTRDRIIEIKERLEIAIKEKNVFMLPTCGEVTGAGWKCTRCKYAGKCILIEPQKE